ncbi:hypothetical protein KCV07_g174, partial [Aureobasidium melanogenum]
MTSSIRPSTRASSLAPHDLLSDDVSEQGPGYQSLKHPAQRFTATTLNTLWILEIAGVIVSIACLTAIVVILAIHDGQPFSSWKFYLSLNTVISILATTSKTTVLVAVTAAISQAKWNVFKAGPHPLKLFQDIDQASRGGMGSLRAIWNSDIGFTVSFGALISMTSLLFQPMTQATISNYGTFDNSTLQATVGSTNKLTGGVLYDENCEDAFSTGRSLLQTDFVGVQIDTDLQKAIIRGFATSESMNISTQLAWTCPTGNCTWPVYASLAVCSECYDVSNLLRSSSTNGSWPMAYRDHYGELPSDSGAQLTEYTLPYANLTIDNWEGYRNATGQNVSSDPTAYMVAKSEMQSNNTIYFKGYESLLMSFSIIRADTGYMSNLSMWQDESPAAIECGLFLCLQAYETTVNSGKLVETIVATTRRKTPRSWHITGDMSSTDSTALGTLDWNPINSNEFDPRTDFQLDASDLNISFPGANETYNATQTFLYSMVDYLVGLLTPENDFNVLDVDYAVVYDKKKIVSGRETVRQYTTSTVQSLYLSSHLDETFLGVANSMTSYLRNAGTHTQKGSVQHWTIHYKIRWPFIALPVFVVFGKHDKAIWLVWD